MVGYSGVERAPRTPPKNDNFFVNKMASLCGDKNVPCENVKTSSRFSNGKSELIHFTAYSVPIAASYLISLPASKATLRSARRGGGGGSFGFPRRTKI
jgi:hypothetical protein